MSGAREIITFQFGNYANYVGTHWWNIQESGFNYSPESAETNICHDVLYREGINHNRQTTFTPRLLLVDLDGSLKHLPREGELYGNTVQRDFEEQQATNAELQKLKEQLEDNEEHIELIEKPAIHKNEFQKDLNNPGKNIDEKNYNFVDSVDTWVDFLYARYHPRTVNIVQEFKHAPDKQTFDTFSCGSQLWHSAEFDEHFCDKIRQYVEECDYLQGFQTIFDCFNGFSGLAVKCIEHLNDEYMKANFVVPLFMPKSINFENADEPMSDSIRVANSALAFQQLIQQASMFVPLSTQDRVWRQFGQSRPFKYLNYQVDNLYHTSAILAAYLDTISLRYRLKDVPFGNTLGGFCSDLTNYERKMAAAAFSMPFPLNHDEDLIDCLDKFDGSLFTQLTPNCQIGTDYITQSLCVRGIPTHRLKRPIEQAKLQMRMAAYKCNSVSEMLQLYLQCSYHASLSHVTSIEHAMRTRTPFPCEIFNSALNEQGFLNPQQIRTTSDKVQSTPALAAVQSSSCLGDTIETLHREAKRIKIAKLYRYKAAGLEDDDYGNALDDLLAFKDKYDDNWEL